MNDWKPGDEAIVMTWVNFGENNIGHADDAGDNAVKQAYTVAGISEDDLILIIPYKTSWRRKFDDKLFNFYVKDPKYRNEYFYLCPKSWAVDRIVKRDRFAPDGSQCYQCKNFVYMAEPNGAALGLAADMFICRSCRHNESAMFMLKFNMTHKEE